MVTKRVAVTKKPTRRKGSLETSPTRIDPGIRRQLVAADAYFRAERRGFAAGHELEDWVAAERAIDSQVDQMRVA